jgi:hypothetical protein
MTYTQLNGDSGVFYLYQAAVWAVELWLWD